MIVSASYKTDIPTFYGRWFMNRLRAGYCKVVNPYSKRVSRVSLARQEVHGFVFWTKNLGPFLKPLKEIRSMGYPFVVQYTINRYPRELECSVVNWENSIEHVKWLSSEFGKRVPVWRYDPIVFTSETDANFHRRNFLDLAGRLEHLTDEVVVSFAQLYKKTERNLRQAEREHRFSWEEPPHELKWNLAKEFAQIANDHGMTFSMCSQREFLAPAVSDAKCVDIERLGDVAGHRIRVPQKGNRTDCGCYASRDIGDYDTCPHGCVYCYAVRDRKLAQRRYKLHDPEGEFIFSPSNYVVECEDSDRPKAGQPPLFEL